MRPADEWHALTPALDIDETDKEMVITAELPGVTEKDVEVNLAGDLLTIKGDVKRCCRAQELDPRCRHAAC